MLDNNMIHISLLKFELALRSELLTKMKKDPNIQDKLIIVELEAGVTIFIYRVTFSCLWI